MGMSCICAIRFWNCRFCPRGQIRAEKWGPKNDSFVGVVVTETLSTFQRVDKWYSRLSLDMYCRGAIRFRNLHFISRVQIMVEKRRFNFLVKFVKRMFWEYLKGCHCFHFAMVMKRYKTFISLFQYLDWIVLYQL